MDFLLLLIISSMLTIFVLRGVSRHERANQGTYSPTLFRYPFYPVYSRSATLSGCPSNWSPPTNELSNRSLPPLPERPPITCQLLTRLSPLPEHPPTAHFVPFPHYLNYSQDSDPDYPSDPSLLPRNPN